MEKYKATQPQTPERAERAAPSPSIGLEDALWSAAWSLAEARKDLATLQGWLAAGELASSHGPQILAERVLEQVSKATILAHLFASTEDYEGSAREFLERARGQAAEYLEEAR